MKRDRQQSVPGRVRELGVWLWTQSSPDAEACGVTGCARGAARVPMRQCMRRVRDKRARAYGQAGYYSTACWVLLWDMQGPGAQRQHASTCSGARTSATPAPARVRARTTRRKRMLLHGLRLQIKHGSSHISGAVYIGSAQHRKLLDQVSAVHSTSTRCSLGLREHMHTLRSGPRDLAHAIWPTRSGPREHMHTLRSVCNCLTNQAERV